MNAVMNDVMHDVIHTHIKHTHIKHTIISCTHSYHTQERKNECTSTPYPRAIANVTNMLARGSISIDEVCVAVYCSVLQCVAVYCGVLQYVAECCSVAVLQCCSVAEW